MKMIYLIISILVFVGCPKSNECGKNFYISGNVIDQNDLPLTDVEVRSVTPLGYDSIEVTTNTSGDFSKYLGKYSDLGNGYIYFRKAGYQNLVTSPVIGKGDGTCNDQNIIRNGKMSP